jgi:hypothetical protein
MSKFCLISNPTQIYTNFHSLQTAKKYSLQKNNYKYEKHNFRKDVPESVVDQGGNQNTPSVPIYKQKTQIHTY